MADIQPFAGIFYNTAVVGGLEGVIAPPYDVINSDQQDALYALNPHNCIRFILNRAEPGDGPMSVYERAAATISEWRRSGALVTDAEPAYYLYDQVFTNPVDGSRVTRSALFVMLKLAPYSEGVVLPHEETRTKAKTDRLNLTRATRANPEPIYGLYEDPDGTVATRLDAVKSGEPLLHATVDGDDHIVWRVADKEFAIAIENYFSDRRVWIADGHHRYETALNYQAEAGGLPGADYILIALTAFNDPGMLVLPTHRLVRNVDSASIESLLEALAKDFVVTPTPEGQLCVRMREGMAAGAHLYGLILPSGAYLLECRDESVMNDAVEGYSDVWKRLDVSILHALALERCLGIPASELATTPDVGYTRDWNEAVTSVRSGEFQLAFMLNQPSATEVLEVAAAGDKMPPKSTFFYPKLWSGLLLRSLE